jgi:undecaprenyl-diphosphatase
MTGPPRHVRLRRWGVWLWPGLVLPALLMWDHRIYEAVRSIRSPVLDSLTAHVSDLRGATFPVVIALALAGSGALLGRPKVWRSGVATLLVVSLCYFSATALKVLLGRPGPKAPQETTKDWFDARYGRFPSSHAAALFGSASSLAAFMPATAPIGFTVAALVGYERIYRGVHFPSDVFAGAWLGIAVAHVIIRWLARRWSWRSCLSPQE